MRAVCMACGEEFEAEKEHVCSDCKVPIGIMCSICYEGFPREDLQFKEGLPICKDCAKAYPASRFSFADQLMTAMRPLTRQIDNLLQNNELLKEILATLSLPRNQDSIPDTLKDLVAIWNRRIIIED